MARNCAIAVQQAADFQDSDPLGARVHNAGKQGMDAAQLAARMALVSIAEDLHEIARIYRSVSGVR
jgi:hypothetical protein